jgi:DNA-directed RNA polymerase II subunit RPB9
VRSNNILYPKEDRQEKVLLYACRNCDHAEKAPHSCVYRNEVHHSEAYVCRPASFST